MTQQDKILILGGTGLVGSAIIQQLIIAGYHNLIHPKRSELDLSNQEAVLKYFAKENPDYVLIAAAKVGGIHANRTFPGDFILENLLIETNVLYAAKKHVPKKLIFLGSSCIYPKNCPQPIKEEYLLTGELESTNEAYAVAKIAGVKLAEYLHQQYGLPFYSLMPTNLYGPNDHFEEMNSHVIPGLITRMHRAKLEQASEFKIWGSGNPKREFLHVDDLAKACILVMNHHGPMPHLMNVGSGIEVSIRELAELIRKEIGLEAKLVFDTTMPDGTMRKLLDSHKIRDLGWVPEVELDSGIRHIIGNYLQKIEK